MENLPIGNTTVDDYRQHVEKARLFKGTDTEYCRLNELDHNKFGYHKSAIKKKKMKNSSSGFARVQPVVEKATKPKMFISKTSLPDPAWLASFLREFSKIS